MRSAHPGARRHRQPERLRNRVARGAGARSGGARTDGRGPRDRRIGAAPPGNGVGARCRGSEPGAPSRDADHRRGLL